MPVADGAGGKSTRSGVRPTLLREAAVRPERTAGQKNTNKKSDGKKIKIKKNEPPEGPPGECRSPTALGPGGESTRSGVRPTLLREAAMRPERTAGLKNTNKQN